MTWLLWPLLALRALLFPVVLGHFFLFCNIFRVRRNYELIWAALFMINFMFWELSGAFDWRFVLGLQSPLTILLITLEVRSPRYHGIFSQPQAPAPTQ